MIKSAGSRKEGGKSDVLYRPNNAFFFAEQGRTLYQCPDMIKTKLLDKRFTEAHPKGLDKRIDKITCIHSTVAAFLNDQTNLKDLLIGSPEEKRKR